VQKYGIEIMLLAFIHINSLEITNLIIIYPSKYINTSIEVNVLDLNI